MKVKKRVLKTEADIKKICLQEVKARYEDISREAAYHSFAMVFFILNRDYGFGKKRLQNLKNDIECEYYTMQASPLGIDYNSDDIMRIVKDKLGIDFNESQFKEGEGR